MTERLRSTHGLVLVAVIGLAVGISVGALIWSGSSSSGGPTTTTTAIAADKRPVALPASLGAFEDIIDVTAARHPSAALLTRQRTHQATVRAQTAAAYSAAFGGAGATYRQYADTSLQKLPYVVAVRAPAPGLTIGPVIDAAFLGLATPERQVKTIGRVSCQIAWSPPTVAGRTPDPSSELTVGCQRSDGGVTVFTGGGGFTGPAGLQGMVDLTNAAWSAASGG